MSVPAHPGHQRRRIHSTNPKSSVPTDLSNSTLLDSTDPSNYKGALNLDPWDQDRSPGADDGGVGRKGAYRCSFPNTMAVGMVQSMS